MLNNVINIDLHIHSKASAYKEEKGFVDKETKENLPILFQALNDRNINLFSITDHNRFDAELYKECTRIINDESNYSNVRGIVAGILPYNRPNIRIMRRNDCVMLSFAFRACCVIQCFLSDLRKITAR